MSSIHPAKAAFRRWPCAVQPWNVTRQYQLRLNPARLLGAVRHRTRTLEAIRNFVSSLKEYLQAFTPDELYLLFQPNGLLTSAGKGKGFVKALSTGRFPKEEIDKFVNGDPSLVDEFIQDLKNERRPRKDVELRF